MQQTEKKFFLTSDGSPTLYMEAFNEYYHSKHGAVQEAKHVYIEMGFAYWQSFHPKSKKCTVFEMGLGTGLNAVLTAEKAVDDAFAVHYHAIEAYPLTAEELNETKFSAFYQGKMKELYSSLHDCPWEEDVQLSDFFILNKIHCLLENYIPKHDFDIVYYDAFGSRSQPEIWEDHCFSALVNAMNPGGVFVTYSAKGSVRRALEKLGLKVELIPGPPGKREMIRGVRPLL